MKMLECWRMRPERAKIEAESGVGFLVSKPHQLGGLAVM